MTGSPDEYTAFRKPGAYNLLLLSPTAIMPPQSFKLSVISCVEFVGNSALMGIVQTASS